METSRLHPRLPPDSIAFAPNYLPKMRPLIQFIHLVLLLLALTIAPSAFAAAPDHREVDMQSIPPLYRKRGGFTPDQILTYKEVGDRKLALDLFYPEGWSSEDQRPGVVFYFGGGWNGGDTRQFYPQAKYLASRGLVAICAEYRTANKDGVPPTECVADAKSAMRYVRAHSAELGIDPAKLIAGGGSAGGHLAAATATISAYDSPADDLSVSPVPQALLLYNPACDNSEEGYGYDRVKSYYQSFSPMENLGADTPPTIIFLGDRDGVFPVPRAKLYQQRMQEAGVRCDLHIYPDQVHGFYNLDRKKRGFDQANNKKYFLETTEQMDRFLASLGYLSGDPTARTWLAKHEGTSAATPAPDSKPNVILILADDLGYEDLGIQGSTDAITPHIDSLATNGIRCTQAYITSPVCSPSRAGILTGRYQNRFGFEFLAGSEVTAPKSTSIGLPPEEVTFADRMKDLGYVTGCVGKWHVGDEKEHFPTARGFDEFYGSLGQSNYYTPRICDSRKGPKSFLIQEPGYYLTDDYSRRAVEFIDKHQAEPFFLYLPHFAVHKPNQATDKYLERFPNVSDPKRRTYVAMLSAMDDAVGLVLEALRRNDLEDNTLLFFLSDNGGSGSGGASNDPLHGGKGSTWEGGIRTPLFIQWKARLPQSKLFRRPVISLDLLPTAIAAAGGQTSEDWNLDGTDLLPYLLGEQKGNPHDALYWRFGTQWAIRKGDWKLLQAREEKGGSIQIAKEGPTRLFNLSEDISEEQDQAAAKPEHARMLWEMWETWAKELPEPAWHPMPVD